MAVTAPDWVANFIGLEFVEKGRTRDGIDCWGLIKLVLREQFGIEDVPDYFGYEHTRHCDSVAKCYYDGKADDRWIAVPNGEEQEGDVVLILGAGKPTHCGLVVHPGTMLHILDGIGSCVDDYRRLKWRPAVEGFYRHRARG